MVNMMRLSPVTLNRIARFRSIKRGYYSFLIFMFLLLLCLVAELLVNSRALVVSYGGNYYFPTYGDMIPGEAFGLGYQYETNYRDLAEKLELDEDPNTWVVLPLVPYNEYENNLGDYKDSSGNKMYPPFPPMPEHGHYLGTDSTGRDIVARLLYGFRIAISFSLILLLLNYGIGVSVGCAMGYFGGKFDIVLQRFIEVFSNIPFLYVVMIVASIARPNFGTFILIMAAFGWMGMTYYMRSSTYKEKAREYVWAARALGATDSRIIFKHILPNSVAIIVMFVPFSVSSGVVALTSLDFLGYGLPAPTPSWGELLAQGTANLDKQWIVGSVITAMVFVLVMVTFIGEAIREAFDPKKHTVYE